MDVLVYLIFGGFMCISGGFCTYGCYRCFTDKEGNKIGSDYSKRSHRTRSKSSKSNSTSLSSFNGTIYTISSDGSANSQQFLHQKILNNSHDYALSINPELVGWTMNPKYADPKGWRNFRRTKTAPI